MNASNYPQSGAQYMPVVLPLRLNAELDNRFMIVGYT